MQWAEHLYLTDKTAKKKDKIIRKANRGIGMLSIYLITLASNPENLFDPPLCLFFCIFASI